MLCKLGSALQCPSRWLSAHIVVIGIGFLQQDERSQHKNKAKALKVLRARLYEAQRQRNARELSSERKGLIGSGDRSERIRTYNFPQVHSAHSDAAAMIDGASLLRCC